MPSIRIRDLENGHIAFDLIDLLEVIGDAGRNRHGDAS